LGTRLRSELPDVPKVLAPVGDTPFLNYVLENLRSFGARRVILALGHLSSEVEEYARTWTGPNLKLVTHVESGARGTGGALREVLGLVESETTLALNGDAFTRADLIAYLAFHRQKRARVSLLLTFMSDVSRYGLVDVDEDGEVLSFIEKPDPTSAERGGYINAGVYLLQREVIAEIPSGKAVSVEKEVFPAMCGNGLYAMRGRFPFIDIGTPESYASAKGFFAGQAARDVETVGSGLHGPRSG
jgi:NDP-sugar pyrophosphorylase family protein